jgi:hypothetical protein
VDAIETLFREIDAALAHHDLPRFELKIVGSTALFAQSTWRRGTKDSDVVDTYAFDPNVREILLVTAGSDHLAGQQATDQLEVALKVVRAFLGAFIGHRTLWLAISNAV